jgi:glyoxalase family protein
MHLEGLHHITAITGDAQRNVDFYAGLLGLRMVKKTVNFDAPDVYHLYYGDEHGAPGSIMTFFEFPGARRGRAGAGQVYRVLWRVASEAALEFWAQRLASAGVAARRGEGSLLLADPEGLELELVVAGVPDPPLVAESADIPAEHAIRGFHGVRAYAGPLSATEPLLDAMGMQRADDASWISAGEERRGVIHWDAPPDPPAIEGAGSVHHIAWSAADDRELDEMRIRVTEAGGRPTPIIDRQYFHSVYFRTPAGVLFELATRDIGFHTDEPLERLGEGLMLPPQHERLRPQLERLLTPLQNPRMPA